MNEINNKKAMERSKTQICSALMELLKTVPYCKVRVSQVCACAGISRTAFYKNFTSMDDVVLYKLSQVEKGYNRKHSFDGEIHLRFQEFYSFIKTNKYFDLLFVKNNLYPLFESEIRNSYLRYMAVQEGSGLEGFQREYMPEYLSATVVSLMRKWAENGFRESTEEMADITVRLMAGYQKLLPMSSISESYRKIQSSTDESSFNPASQADSVSDILNNIPTGVCVLFMPDEAHQEILFANTQQMRLISPDMPAPEKVDPKQSAVRSAYYKNAFSGVHPDDLPAALEVFRTCFNEKQFRIPQIRLRTSSGTYIWVEMDVTLRENLPNGKLFYASYRDISKEVQLRQELDSQRQKNVEKTLLDTIGRLPTCSILYRENKDGPIVPERFSKEYLCFRGYAENETPDAKENGFLQTVHPDDRDCVIRELAASHGERGMHPVVVRILIRGDGYKWVSANFTWFFISEVKYLYVVFTDIDELKKQDQLLQDQYDAAQSFLDSVADSYLMTQRSNLTQNKVDALRGYGAPSVSWEGRSYEELTERMMRGVKEEKDRKNLAELIDRSCLFSSFEKGNRTITREFRSTPDGQETLWLQGVTTLSKHPKSGDIFAFFAVSSIREKKLSEAIIKKIVAEQCDYVSCIDAKRQRIMLFIPNKRWKGRETVHVDSDYEETLNTIFTKYVLLEERGRYREFMKLSNVLALLEKKESISALFHSNEESGIRSKLLEFSYLDKANGLLSLVKTDITEAQQQQLEQEARLRRALERAETATAAKSEFLSGMSHDLRTPLNGVLGFTSFALEEKNPKKKQEYLKKIASSGQLLLDLVNDTLDLSRIESGKAVPEPETVMSDDLVPAVVTALRPTAELKGVQLIEKLSHYQNEPVWADRLKINKIALNLISNSIKFTHAGGTVTVTPYCRSAGSEKECCGFIIEDTGIGMSEEFMKHMYEPFSQEKRSESVQTPGTGLGLSIVKKYVDLLGGTIQVESHLHAGTRWEVVIPVTKLQNGLEEKPKAESPEVLKGRRILLCEDNQMNTEIASMLLKNKGMMVDSAENGLIGLKKFVASKEGYYDLILMDIRMPEMDGYEATRNIRALERQDALIIPIIAMTADAFEESVRAAKEAGMDAYITKPVEPRKMYETLQQYIENSSS
ncbi:MAG: response regulator [Lachnospiraceae bacterium]|jgi:signal transduction histidine kinase/CheY-like chemotaxis protein/AcrR family transcriptional regulator|nr:response regulator [Lachnospiraceae bacterium]MCI1726328.1 response regulator [Lachnospiraceae bacterium]